MNFSYLLLWGRSSFN